MKKTSILLSVLIVAIGAIYFFENVSAQAINYCYPDGCITLNDHNDWRNNLGNYSSYLQLFTAIENAANQDSGSKRTLDSSANWVGISCFNGVTAFLACQNGATNIPTCNICATGSVMSNNQCICTNSATNPPSCSICSSGNVLLNGVCGCANAASNPPACNVCATGSNIVNGICTCGNGAIPQSSCTQCPVNEAMYQNQCMPSVAQTNVCGQKIQGVTVNGKFQTIDGSDPNASCISNFTVSASTVNPNGSVDFSWSIPQVDNVTSRCGFVDLTTPTPRPIPGLQNLDPTRDTARISNIQSTTRFCLICQFYSLLNGGVDNASNLLGNAAVHQWVRVIRIGEQ